MISVMVMLAAGLSAQAAAPPPLSVEEAIGRAIETQLQSKLARATSREDRARVLQAAAALLPQVTASVSQTRVLKLNLAAQGLTGGTIPVAFNPVIGPYDVFDARLSLVQKLLDLGALFTAKQAAANARVSKLQVDLAAEQLAAAAAAAYVEDLRATQSVADARADFDFAERQLKFTERQRGVGLATAVDLARAGTRLEVDRQNMIQASLAFYTADLRLKRVIGAPLAETILLPQATSQAFTPPPDETVALGQARAERLELRIYVDQIAAENDDVRAAQAGFLPTITATGDYGFSGNTPATTARTGEIGAALSLPLISGGATIGEIRAAKARRLAAQERYDDTVIQVEEDVRLARQTMQAEQQDVASAQSQRDLAERELTLAQNRYKAGAGDNIQVIDAQASLADARKSLADALARYADARVSLALALGRARGFQL